MTDHGAPAEIRSSDQPPAPQEPAGAAQAQQRLAALEQQLAQRQQQLDQMAGKLVDLQLGQQRDAERLLCLEEIFSGAPLAQLLIDPQGKIVDFNRQAQTFFNRSADTLTRLSLKTLLSRKALRRFLPAFDLLLENKAAHPLHLLLEKNDKSSFSLLLRWLPDSGLLLAIAQDLDPAAIAQSSDDLVHFALEQLREGVMITDSDGVILKVNHGFSEITGYRQDEVLGKKPSLLHSGQHPAGFYLKMWQSINHHGWWAGEVHNQRKSGEMYPQWLQINRLVEPKTLQTFYVATLNDISDQKQQQQNLDRMAFYDPLTGLPNRCFLEQALKNHLNRSGEQADGGFALLFLDLDRFKEVNDRFGHQEGDLVLKETAQRITSCVRDSDLLARIGGDEFVLLLPRLQQQDSIQKIADNLLTALQRPFEINGHRHYLGASIGAALYPQHGRTPEDLLRRADAAMYLAKDAGRNCWRMFDAHEESRFLLLDDRKKFVWRVIEEPEAFIDMFFQPIHLANDPSRFFAIEALLRLRQQKELGISTQDFILAVEKNRLMTPLGEAIFGAVCAVMTTLKRSGIEVPLCINLSAQQIYSLQLVRRLVDIAAHHQVSLRHCYFEITETAAMENMGRMRDTLAALRDCGSKILLDDFGTGYASLLQLRDLPIDLIKLDKSFVAGIHHDAVSEAVIRAMLAMCRAMNLQVVAEGVEQKQQADWLCAEGVDALQGYLFGQPCNSITLLKELRNYADLTTAGQLYSDCCRRA